MAQIRVTSGTDLAIRIVLMVVALVIIELFSNAVAPTVNYVFSNTAITTSTASVIVAIILFGCFVSIIQSDADQSIAALSTFAYVLKSHGVALSWTDSISVANLFSSKAYNTWYPLKDIANLPRNERRDAIIHIAKKTGRFIEPQNQADNDVDWKRKKMIGFSTSFGWILFVGFGAARHSYSFDINAFIKMGIAPVLMLWVVIFIARSISKPQE